ncbi:uncharacterized protein TRUGW13939_02168 [Talaromyces rugulosus]|uniref:Uncharacterized protein n=1 Tax=Talaromyces rugulosus TaxID=121627 RepID=A0A7H8QMH3_TALRU|nr:uncharacterized protein TRUGW13939_02168 [Talaromyces rugulosus]QKX55076.1 hypothetical protein TRUGW13939_02168 [Talaromyces rugulosus]
MTDGNHSKPVKLSSGEERVLYASSDKAAPQIFLSHHRDSSPKQSPSKEAAKLAELEIGHFETPSLAGWFGNMTLNPKPGANTK